MYFILIPFIAAGLAAKLRNNKYKNTLISPILELNNNTRLGKLNKGITDVFSERQNTQEANTIHQDSGQT